MKIQTHFTLETITLISENESEKEYLGVIAKGLEFGTFKHEYNRGTDQGYLTLPLYAGNKRL